MIKSANSYVEKRICRTSEAGARGSEEVEAEADVLCTVGSVEPVCDVVGKVWFLRDRVRQCAFGGSKNFLFYMSGSESCHSRLEKKKKKKNSSDKLLDQAYYSYFAPEHSDSKPFSAYFNLDLKFYVSLNH